MSTKISNASSTARKVVGSLGVIGAAAAVAGMGTFGTFTDSSTPVATTIQSGTLNIDVTQQGFAVPVTTTGFVPGDSLTRAVNLVNSGNVALGSVTLNTTVATPSVLTTDIDQRPAAGRQVLLGRRGPRAAPPPRPTYTCAGTERVLGSGPAVSNIDAEQPGLAGRGRDGLPDLRRLAAGHRRQHLPGQVRRAEPGLHGHAAHRHRPLITA